jgi:hypothetical protein
VVPVAPVVLADLVVPADLADLVGPVVLAVLVEGLSSSWRRASLALDP